MAKKSTTTAAKASKTKQTTKQRLQANLIHWPVGRLVQGLNWALAAGIDVETDPAEWLLAQEERLLADGLTFDAMQVMAESNGWSAEEALQVLCGYVDQRAADKLLTLTVYLKQLQGSLNARGPAPAAPSKNPAEFDLPPGAVDNTDLPAEVEPLDDQDLPDTDEDLDANAAEAEEAGTDDAAVTENSDSEELPLVTVELDETIYASWLARLQPHWAADNQEALADNILDELPAIHFNWPAVPTGEGLLIVSQLYSPGEQRVYLDLVAGYEDGGNFVYLRESSQRVESFPDGVEVLLDQIVDAQAPELNYGDVRVAFSLPQPPVVQAPVTPARSTRPARVATPTTTPTTAAVKPASAIGGTRAAAPADTPAAGVRTARAPTATPAARTTTAPAGRTSTTPTTPTGRVTTPTTRRTSK